MALTLLSQLCTFKNSTKCVAKYCLIWFLFRIAKRYILDLYNVEIMLIENRYKADIYASYGDNRTKFSTILYVRRNLHVKFTSSHSLI